ncbi:CBP4-domain-containing protein [Mytilinidion resinicola]|uniref:Cytochrome b mRNA-processing protein 4 n=1 Tax=Mytilinidion resinicola TaxID=574789 RepID=A0A6A6YPW3_9PEZI|nr:CBP4-domain-containing protein [Mytilinidion resinicola]KAF2810015.1 CBP4-domain-containing protein [Mytilinidion resinicola]
MCIGGPALVMWVTPTEEELFLRYNPELQKRSLENRREKQEDFDQFVTNLKEYSKSDKPIWTVQKEADEQNRRNAAAKLRTDQSELAAEVERRRQEIRSSTS